PVRPRWMALVGHTRPQTGALLCTGQAQAQPVQQSDDVYSTRFPWTPLWGRRGGPEESGGRLTERQLNGSGELPERWSAKRKTEIVLRLLRGEDLGQISRETQVAPQVIEEWRRAFLAGAEAGLKKRGGDPLESELVRTRAKLGETELLSNVVDRG